MIYGVLGMYTSLLYNVNVATSITSNGRMFSSTMILCFEQFLANNAKFGSLNEVMEFINNIVKEKRFRKFDDREILDKPVSTVDCFVKVMMTCGYRWIPTDNEMDIIWKTINNLNQEDINRVYYKNNLYEFLENGKIFEIVRKMLKKLKRPMLVPKPPEEIKKDLILFTSLMKEYVYYQYMTIDRIDRCNNMIKSVTMISDTDSAIISLDAWYRYVVERINGEEFRIANYCPDPILFEKKDEYGEWKATHWRDCVEFIPNKLDYDFNTDEIVDLEHMSHPEMLTPNDNIRYSIIMIMTYVIDNIINYHMEEACKNNFSLLPNEDDWEVSTPQIYVAPRVNFTELYENDDAELPYCITRQHSYDHKCKIYAKNEF